MRRIQKTFSLEPMTSRMPSVLPAYKDGILYFFDDKSLKEREYQYPTNYGMIPMRISFSSSTIDENVTYGLDCGEESKTISFERLSKWYYFFKEYYHLLNDYGHCNMTYSSATQYHDYESNERYADQMIYGSDEQTYIDLDNKFKEMGGIVDTSEIDTIGAVDKGFYQWICENIVPTYYISSEYTDYWKRNKLFYGDVIRWIAWFEERLFYETSATYTAATKDEAEHWDCTKGENWNCCECEEFFKRGGTRELNRMKEWYNGMQDRILAMNEGIKENLDCFIPTMDDKIMLFNSLDDLGQYSIFSKEYELGTDYRTVETVSGDGETVIHYESGNTHGGTVAEVSGETMILKDGHSGFTFSKYYMEKIYDEEGWDNYTRKYMSDDENKDEFVANGYNFYAFDHDNVMYVGNTEQEVENKLNSAHTYDIIHTDAILIDNTLYTIEDSEYGEYDYENKYMGGRKFFVYRERETSTPYTLVNGKKIYAEWYPYPNPEFSNSPCYYFTFFKNEVQKGDKTVCGIKEKEFSITNYKPFGRKKPTIGDDVIKYISYMGQIFEIEDGATTLDIGNLTYPRVSGYAYDDKNNLMYCISGSVVDSEFLLPIPKSTIEDDKIVVGLDYDVDIYKAKELSGQTSSKLSDLEATDVLTDNIGNKIDGRYNPSKANTYNFQPSEGSELDLLYEVGNTSNIRRFALTAEKNSDVTDDTNYFVGNIITAMRFYYKDVNGNVVDGTVKDWNESSLKTIQTSKEARKAYEESGMIFDGDDIYCDITYYIGATLKRTTNTSYKLAYSGSVTSNNYNYGVRYDETVKFVKENREFYLKVKSTKGEIPKTFNSPSAHSVSYPIYVYKLKQELHDIKGDEYGTYFESPIARFKTEINLIDGDLKTNFSGYNDMDDYNNVHVSPTFKEEYMLGISSLENVDSDIYIERGINAAFERHLKLGEVTSMEALEQYGVNYFKIMEN